MICGMLLEQLLIAFQKENALIISRPQVMIPIKMDLLWPSLAANPVQILWRIHSMTAVSVIHMHLLQQASTAS